MPTWQQICTNLSTGKSGGVDAVNNPLLLLLFILSAASKRKPNCFDFSDCEAKLRDAQERFGPDPSSSPHMAFWHLQSDGCWRIKDASSIPLGNDTNRPNISTMRKRKVTGQVPVLLWRQLVNGPALRQELANLLLSKYFKGDERVKVAVYFWLT